MLTRRTILAVAAASLTLAAVPAVAQDYKAKYPELTFAIIPAENASGVNDRYGPFMDYLSKELGVKVTLRIANDYAAVIEGQRAGNIHIAAYGPASYARAGMTGVEITPLSVPRHSNGATGYYSVLYVKAESAYKTMADLKDKTIALVDPNSTSGNNAPRFFLNRDGYDIDTYFAKNFFAGSHENAVLALAQGTADVAANAWNSEDDSILTRMLTKGMLKNADGSAMSMKDFRIIYKSDFLIEGPYAVLNSMPDDLKAAIIKALIEAPKKDKAAFDKLSDGKDIENVAVTPKDFAPIIGMVKFNDELRKKKGS